MEAEATRTPPPARPVAALPARTTSLLRSSLVIPSIPSILVELVQNALDAQANTVDLFFDLERWSIKIEDNGWGLSRDNLGRVGGERYLTSKLGEGGMGAVETFGFRGEALASIADVAMLEVLTQPRSEGGEEGESYSLVLRGGKRLFNGVAKTKRNSSGTTIWIRDIFYKVCSIVAGASAEGADHPHSGQSDGVLSRLLPPACPLSPPSANASARFPYSIPSSLSASPTPAPHPPLRNVSSPSQGPRRACWVDGDSSGVAQEWIRSSCLRDRRGRRESLGHRDSSPSRHRIPKRTSSSVSATSSLRSSSL